MPDAMLSMFSRPTVERPLTGLTILAVEDSRFASEALRLMCLKSGARLRRAACLADARHHLALYVPGVAIVDLGLPDGSGTDLIAALAAAPRRVPVILGTSGDPDGEPVARAAGADGFLAKPVESLRRFQTTILDLLPGTDPARPTPAETTAETTAETAGDTAVRPDPMALRDDLVHAARLLADCPDAARTAYLSRFLAGIARSAHDHPLAHAARALDPAVAPGAAPDVTTGDARRTLQRLVEARLRAVPAL